MKNLFVVALKLAIFAAFLLPIVACGGTSEVAFDNGSASEKPAVDLTDDSRVNAIINPSWSQVPNSRLDSIGYDWSPNPEPGTFSGLFAWSGGALDTTENRMLVMGGGHTDYGGKEIYAFDFDTLTWSRVSDPENYADLDPTCVNGLLTNNGLPKAWHTYDRLFYDATKNALCDTYGGSGYRGGLAACYGTPEQRALMYCYDFDTNSWTTDVSYGGGAGAAGQVHPVTGELWLQTISGLVRYDPATGVFEKGKDTALWRYQQNKVVSIDAGRELFILLGQDGVSNPGLWAMPLANFQAGVSALDNYKITPTGDVPDPSLTDNYRDFGLAYDPISGKMVAWTGGATVWLLDTGTWVWEEITPRGTPPGTTTDSGTFGRFEYIPSLDKFALFNKTNTNVYLLDLRDGIGTPVTTFDLQSSITDTATPFTTAVGFKKGDVTETPTLDLDNYQVEVKRTWNDGSVKHAIFSGIYNSTAGAASTVTVVNGGSVPKGVDLTEADIVAAAPSASVQLGSIGIVNLADLLGSPQRIWLQGPEMIEAHYQADVSGNTLLSVWFYVRLYAGGELHIRTIVDNGALGDSRTMLYYPPLVTVDGVTVYDNGGVDLAHRANSRWTVKNWVGIANPQTTVKHDNAYLKTTGLVPNYWKDDPSEGTLDGLYQVYSPMENGSWTTSMGNTGYQPQIGLLPNWDALYINSGGDPRAYRSVLANSEALNSYPIIWTDDTTDQPIVLSAWPTWTYTGAGGTGTTALDSSGLSWDVAHHGSGGYLAYLITGDYFHLETMQYQSATIYLVTQSAIGSGVDRRFSPVQTRGIAWSQRTVGQLVAIAPVDAIVSDFQTWFNNGVNYWRGIQTAPDQNGLGIFYTFEMYNSSTAIAPWQIDFWMQSLGLLSDMEPLADMTTLDALKVDFYKVIVGRLGPNGAGSFCYTRASDDVLRVTLTPTSNENLWFDTWGEVWLAEYGSANTNCGTTLLGGLSDTGQVRAATVPAESATGYIGNMLPAIAYAVEDGAPGAAEAWVRLTGAENWSEIENAGFENTPIWGIVPRGWE